MKRIGYASLIALIYLLPVLLPSQISAASTPTPTPVISGEYLEISDLEGMNIYHIRADSTYGAIFLLSDLAGSVPSWGLIYDDENIFYDMYSGWGEVRLRSIILSGYSTQAGDNILLTYDGNQKKRIYLPEMTGYNELYVGLDGSTYYDQWFSQTAQEALPPTPTTTPSPTPTPEGYRTPSPSPATTLTPVGYRTPTPAPSPTPTPYCYCCPLFSGYNIFSLTDQNPTRNAGEYITCLCHGVGNITWWTTGTNADWVEILPEQGKNWNEYQIFVALGDTSSLSPGQHQAEITIQNDYCVGPDVTLYVNYIKPTPIPTATQTPTPIPPFIPTPSPTGTGCAVCDVTVKGYVKDAIDLSPIGDATVKIRGISTNSTTTNDSGYYLVVAMTCWGDFPLEISVSANGYYSQSIWEDVECDNTYYYDFNLIPKPPVFCQGGDYDGDGSSDIAIFRPASGLWAVRGITRSYFGRNSDIPVAGDYSGSGTTSIGIFRGSSGMWVIRGMTRAYFGSLSDYAVPGDYDGDGSCDIGIFRESSGLWALRGITRIYFGQASDLPVSGDYDGDGISDLAVYRGSLGLWGIRGISRIYFGTSDDNPVPGDYNGEGFWSPGIFRGTNGLWAVRGVTKGYYGRLGDEPVPADYQGNGRDDIGIFRDSSGLWAIRGVSRVYFGSAGDIPVTR